MIEKKAETAEEPCEDSPLSRQSREEESPTYKDRIANPRRRPSRERL